MGQNFAAMAYVATEVRAGRLPDKNRTDAEIQALYTANFEPGDPGLANALERAHQDESAMIATGVERPQFIGPAESAKSVRLGELDFPPSGGYQGGAGRIV